MDIEQLLSTAPQVALTEALRANASAYEAEHAWPSAALSAYGNAGGWKWGIPPEFGGLPQDPATRLAGYVSLARGDMSAALYITQHEGAVDLLVGCGHDALKQMWLPRFASGEALTSIGYSQLTTSRQAPTNQPAASHTPAMRAERHAGGYRLNGVMPWVTGAPYITNVACGATMDDGQQLLLLVPLDAQGIRIEPAAPLAALNSSHTCEVFCDDVVCGSDLWIAGPEPAVLAQRSALRLLLVSATALGLSLGIADEIARLEAAGKSGGEPGVARAISTRTYSFGERLLGLANDPALNQAEIDALRIDLNDWLVRIAGTVLVCGKGTGFYQRSTAQRLAREAMFFCVWSASTGVRNATINALI